MDRSAEPRPMPKATPKPTPKPAKDRKPDELLPLTPLTYQVLLAMADGALHGYGVIKEVSARTKGEMELEAGTLYAAIKRLRDEGLIDVAAPPRRGNVDSRRRYYRLTPFGRQVLKRESERLLDLVELARAKKVLPEGSPS